tara:strand:- start:110 stop:244 length:135 start_codon:yes stop_codon:yes gene_type:complete
MKQDELEKVIYQCLNGFPKNINFYSDYAKIVIAKTIAKRIKEKK